MLRSGRLDRVDLLRALALALAIALVWCLAYGRTSASAWATPIDYEGDSLFLLAYLKAAHDGHLVPGASLLVPELNAPFEANWNDHPRTLQPVFFVFGLLSRALGLFAALNLLLLLAHVLAGVSLFAVARRLGARPEWALAGGLSFGLAHFLFWRSLWHLDLALAWHLPLCVLVLAWGFASPGIALRSRRFLAAAAITATAAVHNPYYGCVYGQFLLLVALAQLVRGRRKAVPALLLLVAVLAATFLLVNAGSLAYQVAHGTNPAASRPYGNLERFAMKPIELLLASPGYGLADWGRLANLHWERRVYKAEGGSVYLGLVGAGALLGLLAVTFARVVRRPGQAPPQAALAVGWIVAYSMLGGVNQLVGLMGFMWLRGTNRLSVWILAVVLLYLVTRRFRRGWASRAAAALVAVLALADQIPRRDRAREVREMSVRVAGDRSFVEQVESALPAGAMLFMLPVVEFPEGPRVLEAKEYDHLRPYLHSHTLRFSFGSDKGRPREAWQHQVAALPAPVLAERLERCGFAGLLIHRKAYAQGGVPLLQELAAGGWAVAVAAPSSDYVLVRLRPPGHPNADACSADPPSRPAEPRPGTDRVS